jgi:hypothetical protein
MVEGIRHNKANKKPSELKLKIIFPYFHAYLTTINSLDTHGMIFGWGTLALGIALNIKFVDVGVG